MLISYNFVSSLRFLIKLQSQMFSGLRIVIVCFALLVASQCGAQLVLNTYHYSTQDGLADNRITVITKDRDGFMWFGSWAGISRFDGYQFKTFKSYPGDKSPLKSNRIDEIVEDGKGQFLWLGAYDKHIYRFDKRSGVFVSLAQLLNDSAVGKITFLKILAVSGADIWFKT
jgi:ligand-binding sensor domain-containing protein